MVIIITDEMKRLEAIYRPYRVHGEWKDNTPQYAIDAFNKEGELIHQVYKNAGYKR